MLLGFFGGENAYARLEGRFIAASASISRCSQNHPRSDCYNAATQVLDLYLDSRPDRTKRYAGERAPVLFSGPRAHLTGHPTEKVFVLVHSFSKDPSEMETLAAELSARGHNVFSVLLEGHGTRSALAGSGGFSLFDVSRKSWQRDVRFGVDLAKGLGEKIYLVGYSLGGLLSVLEGSQRFPEITGFLAIAPPVAINDALFGGASACTAKPLLPKGLREIFFRKKEGSGYEKARFVEYLSGTCELLTLVTDFNRHGRRAGSTNRAFQMEYVNPPSRIVADEQRVDFRKLRAPYVLIASRQDDAVDFDTLERLTSLSAGKGTLLESPAVDHGDYGMAAPGSKDHRVFVEALDRLEQMGQHPQH